MVWLNRELMRRRRMELGWTPEALANEADLNRRTVQRLEEGRNEARLGTAVAIAQALEVELSLLIFVDEPSATAQEDDDRVVAAFKAADDVIQKVLSRGGPWGLKEATCVLSLLLTRYGSAFARQSDDGLELGLGSGPAGFQVL